MYQTCQIVFQRYDSAAALSSDDQALLAAARGALALAYAPYSHFRVGAAARLSNGAVVGGANFENAAYPMCLCAERSTLAAAVSQHPDTPIVALAITASAEQQPLLVPPTPCGACRQVLFEAEQKFDQPIRLILQGDGGPVLVFERVGDLLPFPFDAEVLRSI